MGRHAGIGAVDLGIVQAGLDDAGFEVVRYNLTGHAAEIGEGADMRTDPVGQRLRPGRLGIAIAGSAQGGDEDLGRANLAGKAVDHLHRGAGVIDEQLLADDMGLTHGRVEPAAPIPVEIAKPAVAVTPGMNRAVFLPQQRHSDAGPLEFAMQGWPIGRRPAIGRNRWRRRKQQPFQVFVRKPLGLRPTQAGAACPAKIIADRRAADVQADGNPPLRQSAGVQP
jgi:hypothetical protein